MVLLREPAMRKAVYDAQVAGPEGTVYVHLFSSFSPHWIFFSKMSETGITDRAPGFLSNLLGGLGFLGEIVEIM